MPTIIRRTRERSGVNRAIELTCHPLTTTDAVRGIRVDVTRAPAARLHLEFVLTGEMTRLRVPAFGEPRIGSELWRHTCFEVFIAANDAATYHELNFAPSGEWAVLAFRGYRDGQPLASGVPTPAIAVRITSHSLELDVVVALDGLSPVHTSAPLRLALATVVEERSGARSYWAAHHPPGEPDFHHADAFVVRVEPPVGAC